MEQQVPLRALRRVRQGLEQLQSFGEVADSLHIRRALDSLLPCLLPVRKSLL